MTDPLFSEPAREEKRWGNVYNGRYHLPMLGREGDTLEAPPRGWMRVTNLVGAYADQRALQIWEVRHAMTGLRDRPDLYARLSVMPNAGESDVKYPDVVSKSDALGVWEEAKDQAKANQGAVWGTAHHVAWEHWQRTGELIGTPEMQEITVTLIELLKTHLLWPVPEYCERLIVNDELKVAGRFDTGLGPDLLLADLKTKKDRFYSLLEVRAQLAIYARATAMWDADRLCYVDPPPFDPDWGITLHAPNPNGLGVEGVQLLNMDLEAGYRTALRAREVVDDRAAAKSIPMLREMVRKAPAMHSVESWAARIALVETLEEGQRVMQECMDTLRITPVDMPHELRDLARDVSQRILGNSRQSG